MALELEDAGFALLEDDCFTLELEAGLAVLELDSTFALLEDSALTLELEAGFTLLEDAGASLLEETNSSLLELTFSPRELEDSTLSLELEATSALELDCSSLELDATSVLLEEARISLLELTSSLRELEEFEAISALLEDSSNTLLELTFPSLEDSRITLELDKTFSELDEDKSTEVETKTALTSTSKFGISKAQLPSTAEPPIPHIPGVDEPVSTFVQGTTVLASRARTTLTEATL
jgi:hypothetical protein